LHEKKQRKKDARSSEETARLCRRYRLSSAEPSNGNSNSNSSLSLSLSSRRMRYRNRLVSDA
jgi:hypothetical protein